MYIWEQLDTRTVNEMTSCPFSKAKDRLCFLFRYKTLKNTLPAPYKVQDLICLAVTLREVIPGIGVFIPSMLGEYPRPARKDCLAFMYMVFL